MHTRTTAASIATAITASIALVLSGCSSSNDGGGGSGAAQSSGSGQSAATSGSSDEGHGGSSGVSTTVPDGDIALKLSYVDDPPTEDLVKGFEKKHQNVKIKTTQVPFGDYIKSIKRAMNSDDPPDIAEYNPGAMRTLVPAGLILDLDPYAKAYDWDSTFAPSSLEALTSSKNAKQYNTGSLYAIPGAMSMVGVFYNKTLFSKADLDTTPSTLDDFVSDLKALKSNNIQPLSVGGLEVGGFQLWDALTNVLGNASDYKAWIYGKDGASIQTDAAKKAAQDIVDWTKAGYISSDASAVSDSDALANFANGKAAMLVTGNWNTDTLNKKMGDSVGFFLMPGKDSDAKPIASGSSVAFSVSAKTKHPNAAAAFLNYLGSADAAQIEADSGFSPVDTDADVTQNALGKVVTKDYAKAAGGQGIIAFPDYASPGMINKLESGIQGLITGHTSPSDYLKSLQSEWDSYHNG